jgi:hypothetical protein
VHSRYSARFACLPPLAPSARRSAVSTRGP